MSDMKKFLIREKWVAVCSVLLVVFLCSSSGIVIGLVHQTQTTKKLAEQTAKTVAVYTHNPLIWNWFGSYSSKPVDFIITE